jgi:acetate kinase
VNILVLNSGSSSQKSALFTVDSAPAAVSRTPLWEARIEWETGDSELRVKFANGRELREPADVHNRRSALEAMLRTLWSGPTPTLHSPVELDVVGHRVVHGGPKLTEPKLVTAAVKDTIARASAFAPLHSRAELEGIEIVEHLVGGVPQVAVFDTGFHRTLPLEAAVYPGPYAWFEHGIRRYGFHGINHQYCAQRAPQILNREASALKMVSCHLGNGCSLAAIEGGRSVDTTMGFTPLDGLMMGTRSGSVDPSILTYLLRYANVSVESLDRTLNHESGLLGISGVSSDMRQVLAAAKEGNDRARLAFDIFVHRLQAGIGSMAAVLGGMDVLVFTGGIGENASEVRAAACAKLGFFGIALDQEANLLSPADEAISSSDSRVKVLIIQAQEDWAIAQICHELVGTVTSA